MNPLDPYTYLNQLNSWANQLPLAYAFGAGMVASINPCGFLMLPSFAAFYLSGGREGAYSPSPVGRGARALFLGAVVTLGFLALFGTVGLLIATGGRWLVGLFPWSGLAIGIGLVLLGLWLLLAGRGLGLLAASRVQPRWGRSPGALFAFGLAYGVASLACTLPVFLIVVGSALAAQGPLVALIQFLNYALGMGLVLTAVALSLAYFEGAFVGPIRALIPLVERLGPAFLLLAGAYLIYFWFHYGRLLT